MRMVSGWKESTGAKLISEVTATEWDAAHIVQ